MTDPLRPPTYYQERSLLWGGSVRIPAQGEIRVEPPLAFPNLYPGVFWFSGPVIYRNCGTYLILSTSEGTEKEVGWGYYPNGSERDPLEAPTVEQLAKCAACRGKACAGKQKALEDSYSAIRRVLTALNTRTALLRKILDQGRLEAGELRDQVEEECR
jgi:hypothetical protein